MPESWPLAFLQTRTCYGSWFHGDQRGSMDRHSQSLGSGGVEVNRNRALYEGSLMKGAPFVLSNDAHHAVDKAIRGLCERREWRLGASNVRTNHVHAVVSAGIDPARILQACKAAATRELVQSRPGPSRYACLDPTR